jgi:hypothetical protein
MSAKKLIKFFKLLVAIICFFIFFIGLGGDDYEKKNNIPPFVTPIFIIPHAYKKNATPYINYIKINQ